MLKSKDMSLKNIALAFMIIVPTLYSCEKYEDYTKDYDYSAVYFGSQKPLRTVVAGDEMKLKFGVALAGVRENNREHWANYEIDPDLLSEIGGADQFQILPEEYYSLSNEETFIIPPGEVIGDVTLTLASDFLEDADAHKNTYALPVRVTEASVDSILGKDAGSNGMDYSVIVIKYMSPYGGDYYHKGVEKELDGNGEVVNENLFWDKDLSKNSVMGTTTLGSHSIQTNGIGDSRNGNLNLTVNNEDHTVSVDYEGPLNFQEGEGVYDDGNNAFYLDYSFIAGGTQYEVTDTLVQIQSAEESLRFEEW